MKTEALDFPRGKAVEVKERTLPALGEKDILVRVAACGVCHGDVSLFHSENPGSFPTFAGHEAAGIVEEVGPDVTSVKVGDAVALLGQERFSTYTVANAAQAIRISGPVKDWAQWIVEPIACCVNGVSVAEILPDDVVAVVGCGFMGLGLLQCLRLSPARLRIALALRQFSLDAARNNGADETLLSTEPDLMERIRAIATPRPMPTQYIVPGFPNGPCDVVFEASGTAGGLDLASRLVRIGGTLVMFGHQEGHVSIDGTLWHMSGLRVLNASPMIAKDFTQIFYRTAGLIQRGALRVDNLITHRAPFTAAEDVFGASKKPDYIKGIIMF